MAEKRTVWQWLKDQKDTAWTCVKAFFKEIYDFVKVPHTDANGDWDFQKVIGTGLVIFGVVYLGWMDKGNISAFLAVAGMGCALHGWSATPWGGSGTISALESKAVTGTTVLRSPLEPTATVNTSQEAPSGIGER